MHQYMIAKPQTYNKTKQSQTSDNSDDEALSFLDKYKLSLKGTEGINLG